MLLDEALEFHRLWRVQSTLRQAERRLAAVLCGDCPSAGKEPMKVYVVGTLGYPLPMVVTDRNHSVLPRVAQNLNFSTPPLTRGLRENHFRVRRASSTIRIED
jgi:hypothetical protein